MTLAPEVQKWVDSNGGASSFGYLSASQADYLKNYLNPDDLNTQYMQSGSGYVYKNDYLDNKVSVLNTEEQQKYAPILGDVKPITTLGTSSYFDKAALDAQLNKYTSLDSGQLQPYSVLPEYAGLSPVASIDGRDYYDIGLLNTANTSAGSKYATLTTGDVAKYGVLDGFSNLKPVASVGDTTYYDQAELKDFFGKYSSIDTSQLGDDPLSSKVKGYAKDIDGTSYINSDVASYYSNLSNSMASSRIGYYSDEIGDYTDLSMTTGVYQVGDTPYYRLLGTNDGTGDNYFYIPYEAVFRVQSNPADGKQLYQSDALSYFAENSAPIVLLDGKTLDIVKNEVASDFSNVEHPELGFLMSGGDWWSNMAVAHNSENVDWTFAGANDTVNTGHGVHQVSNLNGAWFVRASDLWDNLRLDVDKGAKALQNAIKGGVSNPQWIAQSEKDLSLFAAYGDGESAQAAYDTYVKKNWAAQALDVLQPVATVLQFIPGYQMIGAAMNVGMGIGSGNLGQVVGGLAGLSGVTGSIGSTLGSALGAAGNKIIEGALGGAVVGGLSSGLSGGDFSKGMLGGAVSGGIGGAFSGTSFLQSNPIAGNALVGGLQGAGAAAVTGGDISKGLLVGAVKGGASAAMKDWEPTESSMVNNAIKSGATSALSAVVSGQDPTMAAILSAGGSLANSVVQDALKSALPTLPARADMTEQERTLQEQQKVFGGTYTDVYNQSNAGIQAGMLNNQIYGNGVGSTVNVAGNTVLDSTFERQGTDGSFADFAQKSTYNSANFETGNPDVSVSQVEDFLKGVAPDVAGGAASGVVQGVLVDLLAPGSQDLDSMQQVTRSYGADPGDYDRMIYGRDLRTGFVSEAVKRTRG